MKYYQLREIRAPLFEAVQSEIKSQFKSFDYLKSRNFELVNMSIGSEVKQGLTRFLQAIWRSNFLSAPSNEVQNLYIEEIQKYLSAVHAKALNDNQDKLFLLAAGNRVGAKTNNLDLDPQFPTSTSKWFRPANLIVVAATQGRKSLAHFSSFGIQTVDIAAPGVNIESYAPGGLKLFMTGTSQATPAVTNTAARMLEINPKLLPKEIKMILMETVDKKDFLKEAVLSGGIINPPRAVAAARLRLHYSLEQAIMMARILQDDLP